MLSDNLFSSFLSLGNFTHSFVMLLLFLRHTVVSYISKKLSYSCLLKNDEKHRISEVRRRFEKMSLCPTVPLKG
jgi:hypothetical protein